MDINDPKSKEECLMQTIEAYQLRLEQLEEALRRERNKVANLENELAGQSIIIEHLSKSKEEVWKECVEDTIKKMERWANGEKNKS